MILTLCALYIKGGDLLEDDKNVRVNVSGIIPAQSGTDSENKNWFIIDESGEFSVDKNIIATVWLVGGGCDGGDGIWNGNEIYCEFNEDGSIKKDENGKDIYYPMPDTWKGFPDIASGTSYSGHGGNGGYVYTVTDVKIPKNKTLTSIVAERNDRGGTSLNVNGTVYRCDGEGYVARSGGMGGSVLPPEPGEKYAGKDKVKASTGGTDGVRLPFNYVTWKEVKNQDTLKWEPVEVDCNYVGSSGGGGASCDGTMNADNGIVGGIGAGDGTDHRHKGTSGFGYGCGGGGGAICGQVARNIPPDRDGGYDGGSGKQGCIIISYIIDPTQPTLIVQKHYKKICNTHKTCNTDYYSNNSHKTCCGNTGCGCKSVNGNYEYTDTIHIGSKSGK